MPIVINFFVSYAKNTQVMHRADLSAMEVYLTIAS
jgi:hypothetical protein